MKRRFNKNKCLDNLAPLLVGIICVMMIAYMLFNPEKFFTTLK